MCQYDYYRQISNIRRTKYQNPNISRLVSSCRCLNLLKPCVKSDDVVGAAPTGDAPPTTSEWSTIFIAY